MQKVVSTFPTDPGLKIQMLVVYRLENKLDQAIGLYEQALKQGYAVGTYSDIKWAVDYYDEHKQYIEAINLVQQATAKEQNNVVAFVRLAKLYAAAGQYAQARDLATRILAADPKQSVELQPLLDSLPK